MRDLIVVIRSWRRIGRQELLAAPLWLKAWLDPPPASAPHNKPYQRHPFSRLRVASWTTRYDLGHPNRQDECPQGEASRSYEGAILALRHLSSPPTLHAPFAAAGPLPPTHPETRNPNRQLTTYRRNARSSRQSTTPRASGSATRSSARGSVAPRSRRTIPGGG